jgi:molybdopterin molybdotransferase
MLRGLVHRDGGRVVQVRRIPDDRDALRRALAGAPGDVVLVSGGSSVGEEDHAPGLLAESGTLAFHGVLLRPAAPTGAGTFEGRPVFLLPGNPVSCLSAYDLLAGRLVRRLAGRAPDLPYRRVRAPLCRKISSVLGRVDYVRVRVGPEGVDPVMSRGASILTSTTIADGFVLVGRELEGYPEGAVVEVYLYAETAPPRGA